MEHLHYRPITEVGVLIRSGEISSRDLVDSALGRIADLDGTLGAVSDVLAESAIAEAQVADCELAAGRWRGPLHGVPIGRQGPD
jgi:Asp-tRNA(Asn)/Glu-tRNA(Gln) amidotransferase A subunit family amidase